jgi:hypothetical protein
VHTLLDRLATEYGAGPHAREIAQARDEYFNQAGKVFEDDAELFESRLASFLEWYAIERPFAGGPPPVVRALDRALAEGAPAEERLALANIAASHRSLFDLIAVDDRKVHLDDLLGGARFQVVERRSTIGFEAGDLMEARLVWDGAQVVFGKTFLFHPRDARAEALDLVEGALARGTRREEIMFELSRRHVRWHRHGHVAAARVYRGGL